jgi:predicted transcriptional regulator
MRKTTPVTVRLEQALNNQVTASAAALERPTLWVIEQSV